MCGGLPASGGKFAILTKKNWNCFIWITRSSEKQYTAFGCQLLHSILNNLISNSLSSLRRVGTLSFLWSRKAMRHYPGSGYGFGYDRDGVEKAVFKPFQQVSEEKEKRRVGTGLGLSIVSQFTQLMSGTVDMESQKERGPLSLCHFPAGVMLP